MPCQRSRSPLVFYTRLVYNTRLVFYTYAPSLATHRPQTDSKMP